MSVVRHTPESLARWEEADAQDPARAKLRELTVAYVTAQGGLMLDVWRLYMGPWFGEPEMMLLSEVGKRLGISEWHAENIVRATDAVVVPQWRRTPEFRDSEFGDAAQLSWPAAFQHVLRFADEGDER
jgi:hypothetical protein